MVVIAPEEPVSTIIIVNVSDIHFLISTSFKNILHWDRITALLSAMMLDSRTYLGSLGNMPMNMMVVMAPEKPMSTAMIANLSNINYIV
jgi:hypothetical protein